MKWVLDKRVVGKAHARAGLLGNPSDVYEGKAIAFSLGDFGATVTLEAADRFEIVRGASDELAFPSLQGMTRALAERGCYDGMRLIRAAIRRFSVYWPQLEQLPADAPELRFTLSYQTTIPRQVGLAGSSAIIIATLRALLAWFRVEITPLALAELALSAELEDLGIQAGPMDRVIQAYEGLLHMDFRLPRTPASFTPLSADLLPPLFIAWDPRGGEISSRAHSDVRQRWLLGDPAVRSAMALFPQLVDEGMACLQRRDFERFRALVDRNFDTRASIWKLSDRDLELVAIGRACDAAVKFCGSGGSVVGVLRDAEEFDAVRAAYRASGFDALRPTLLPAIASAHARAPGPA